ncbi:MAG: tetratricopeptide repeat protein [Phycisphaerae bacterium]
MSYLLELLGRGADTDLEDLLARYYWAPQPQSIEELQQVCNDRPDQIEVRFQLGLAYLRGSQPKEATEHLQEVCRRKPDHLAARLAVASAYLEGGEADKALDNLQIAHQNHPGEPPILFAIGFCHEKRHDLPQAADYYRHAIQQDNAFLVARERLAAVAVMLEDTDEAIRQYLALRQASPEKAWIRCALAHLYYRAGQYDLAVDEFETAIAMEPENWALMDDEVEALISQGQLREAIERLHALIEEQPDEADLHVRLADVYSRVGDDDAAMKHYLTAIDLEPTYLEGLVKLGTHQLIFGRWEEAAELFHRAADLNDQVLLSYIGLGVAQAAAGRRGDAINSFDLAAAIEPNSTVLLAEMARLQLKVALADEFANSLETGQPSAVSASELSSDHLLHMQIERHADEVREHPNHPDLRYRYGVLLRAEGRHGEALEQFAKAVDLNPTYVQAIMKLGLTRQELGMTDEAIETYRMALEIKPDYVDLHYRLGVLYTDRRQFEDAVRHMESAAKGAPDNEQIRAGLALSLQNMGLMDRAAATWRSLWKIHHART